MKLLPRVGSSLLRFGLLSACLLLASSLISAAPVKIMPLGDSITRGGGSSGEAGYRRPLYHMLTNAGYDVVFTGSLINGTPPDFDIDHEGHGSYRADQVRDTVYDWLNAHDADILLLHIGTNDIAGGNQEVAEVAGILDEIDRWKTDHGADLSVVIARIVLRYDGNDPTTVAYNDAVESLVNSRIAAGDDLYLVDMEHALSYPTDLRDGVHPNDIGYVKMAGVWFDALTAILPTPTMPAEDIGVGNVVLEAATPANADSDDLTCSYTLQGDAVTAAVAWSIDAAPVMSLYLPIEGGTTGATNDYSGNSQPVSASGSIAAAWRPGEGHDGFGALAFSPGFYLNAGECFPISSSYTKVAWVNLADTASNNIISSEDVTGGHVLYASISQNFRLSAGQDGLWNLVQDPDPLVFGTWYHVAVTFDYATGMMVLYKNGSVVDTATVPVDKRDITDATVEVGAFSNGSAWEGLIDEARVYATALSPAQIGALYQGGAVIDADETSVGQAWQATVTPFSDNAAGDAVASNTITVGDPDPWVDNVAVTASSPNNLSSDDLDCSYSIQGSATTASTAWYLNNTPLAVVQFPFEGGPADALLDVSGNANDAAVYGSSPQWVADAGPDGHGAFAFNVGGSGQQLTAGPVFPTASSYTKAAWVKRTGSGSNNIMSGVDAAGGHVFFASTSSQNDHLAAGHDNHFDIVYDSTGPLELDTWYHVAVTFDYTSGEMVLYKDGTEVDRATVLPSEREVTDPELLIGSFAYSSQWHGYIDDARVYDRVLSGDEISALYEHGGNRIAAAETEVGHTWYAEVTPFSTTEAGATVVSNAVFINPTELQPPTLGRPCEDSICTDMVPTFEWGLATGPYVGRTIYYRLELATEPALLFVSTIDSLVSPQYTWDDSLDFHDDYCWNVTAWVDLDTAIVEAPSETWCFWTWTVGDIDADHSLSVSDLTALVEYLFAGGQNVYPEYVADIDNVCGVNISDLTYLVEFLFQGGSSPQLPNCP